MKYTVTATDAVQQQLADIYLRAADKNAVQQASDRIDVILKFAPEKAGAELGADRRLLILWPLAVVFRVLPDDYRVEVLRYRYLGR